MKMFWFHTTLMYSSAANSDRKWPSYDAYRNAGSRGGPFASTCCLVKVGGLLFSLMRAFSVPSKSDPVMG